MSPKTSWLPNFPRRKWVWRIEIHDADLRHKMQLKGLRKYILKNTFFGRFFAFEIVCFFLNSPSYRIYFYYFSFGRYASKKIILETYYLKLELSELQIALVLRQCFSTYLVKVKLEEILLRNFPYVWSWLLKRKK